MKVIFFSRKAVPLISVNPSTIYICGYNKDGEMERYNNAAETRKFKSYWFGVNCSGWPIYNKSPICSQLYFLSVKLVNDHSINLFSFTPLYSLPVSKYRTSWVVFPWGGFNQGNKRLEWQVLPLPLATTAHPQPAAKCTEKEGNIL